MNFAKKSQALVYTWAGGPAGVRCWGLLPASQRCSTIFQNSYNSHTHQKSTYCQFFKFDSPALLRTSDGADQRTK